MLRIFTRHDDCSSFVRLATARGTLSLIAGMATVFAALVWLSAIPGSAVSAEPAKRAEFIRMVLEVHVSMEDVARVTAGAKDPLTGDKHLNVAPLVRAFIKPIAIDMATDPDNIGLPNFSTELARFKTDDKFYLGDMTIDFYLKRK
jgi:hypothetical protein